MQQNALGWYVQTLTRSIGSEYWLGLTSACQSLPIVFFSAHGGMVADRFAKRPLLVLTQAVAMVLAITFGFLITWDMAPLWSVLCFAAMLGTTMAYDIPIRQAFAVEMVGRRDLMSGIALNSAVFNVGRFTGPMIAGFVISTLGIAACFVFNGLSFLGVIIALSLMVLPKRPKKADVDHSPPDLLGGFRTVLQTPRLLGMLGMMASVLITGGAYLALLPALADNHLGLNEKGYAALMSCNGLGGLLGALMVASVKEISARKSAIKLGIGLIASGLIVLSFCNSVWTACPVLVITGAGLVLFLASTNSTVQLSISDSIRGRVMGIWVLIFGASQPIGSYTAGNIAHYLGTPTTLLCEGFGCLAAGVWAVYVLSLPEPEQEEIAE